MRSAAPKRGRGRLAAAVPLAFLAGWGLGCGGGTTKKDGAGPRPDGGGGGPGSARDGGVACTVQITPVIPASLDGIVPGPTARVRVRGEIFGVPGPTATWSWLVAFADGSGVLTANVNADPSLIEFPVRDAGSYTVRAMVVAGPHCVGERRLVARAPNAKLGFFRFRLISPPGLRLPPQETEVQVFGATPTDGNKIPLSAGADVVLDPRDELGAAPVSAYLRLTGTASGLVVEGHTRAGPLRLQLAADSYRTLVVPDGAVAPALLPARRPPELAVQPIRLAAGVPVAGVLVDGAGAAVRGAHVTLRDGELPSTVGVSANAGAFTLRARSGKFGASIVPPPETSLPLATVAAEPGVVVDGATQSVKLEFQWSPLPTAALSFSVRSSAGAAAAPGARVFLRSDGPLPRVGTLKVTLTPSAGTPLVLAATGLVRSEHAADASGNVIVSGLPRGRYRAVIFPAAGGPASDAVTAASFDVTDGDLFGQTVTLAQKVTLAGRLLPGADTDGVNVVAVDTGPEVPATAFSARAGADGRFEIAVNPLRTYAMVAEPRPGHGTLARTALGSVAVSSASVVNASDRTMTPGLLFAGAVADESLHPIGGTIIQVYCVGCGSADPVAETVSRSDGFFQLTLPDPGTGP